MSVWPWVVFVLGVASAGYSLYRAITAGSRPPIPHQRMQVGDILTIGGAEYWVTSVEQSTRGDGKTLINVRVRPVEHVVTWEAQP